MILEDLATTRRSVPTRTTDLAIPWSKRALDIVVATIAIVLLLPVLAVVALTILLTSAGPVVYRQQRIGRGGGEFTILKFRTMVQGADERIDAVLTDPAQRDHYERHGKVRSDPRITPVGRVLRLLSLDELPQLWNVIRGDMSLVGPRPRWDAAELERYGSDLDAYLSVLPGLTGPWQVGGRSTLPDEQRVTLDVDYARTRTFVGDLVLVLRTVPVLLWPFGRGAA